ncbi:DUF3817 domain-containing protein [Kytococcus schroeteri]|uniref:DUF3817 domain-containing protein n=1 Tax=Kytococcus schroeteri TaxID=138300 RepID=UPI0035F0D953
MAQPIMRPHSADDPTIRPKLTVWRVLAFVESVALLILIGVMVAKYGFGMDRPSQVWSPIHGFIFMAYAVATAVLCFGLHWGLGRMLWIMLSGCIPFWSFVMERTVTRDARLQVDGPFRSTRRDLRD